MDGLILFKRNGGSIIFQLFDAFSNFPGPDTFVLTLLFFELIVLVVSSVVSLSFEKDKDRYLFTWFKKLLLQPFIMACFPSLICFLYQPIDKIVGCSKFIVFDFQYLKSF